MRLSSWVAPWNGAVLLASLLSGAGGIQRKEVAAVWSSALALVVSVREQGRRQSAVAANASEAIISSMLLFCRGTARAGEECKGGQIGVESS